MAAGVGFVPYVNFKTNTVGVVSEDLPIFYNCEEINNVMETTRANLNRSLQAIKTETDKPLGERNIQLISRIESNILLSYKRLTKLSEAQILLKNLEIVTHKYLERKPEYKGLELMSYTDAIACCGEREGLLELIYELDPTQDVEGASVAYDKTPLMQAAKYHYTSYVRFLLLHGAKPNARAKLHHNNTPLHFAVVVSHLKKNWDEEVFLLLLKGGADPTIKNDQGLTPAELAKIYQPGHIVARIEQLFSQKLF